ncbi:uncharacterized protein LOC129300846 isoform X3 [Prosopis cineraria]|nr:uncharacterized protein LOC129300846 isoform X3 [Prosopis cineraria]XP_054795419.1 uncharacterized protein LOC129300846 isoform X3 [Prosopis cineraria]
MVCSFGSGRMAVIARLLAAGRFSQTRAEEIGHQKSAAEYVFRDLRDADEANLLDEEDMHVYGLRPMSDPLQLVCCNACKKPIQASQYAAHAELCRSLKYAEQTILEVDGSMGYRKPPRKEKKKLSSTSCANQAPAVGEEGRAEAVDSIDAAVPPSHMNDQIRVTCYSNDGKDAASMMDGTGFKLGNRDHPASVMQPPTKRRKLIGGVHSPLPESPATESRITRPASFANKNTCKGGDMLERTVSENGDPSHKNFGLVQEQHLTKRDGPAPLATKVYYSQRNNRLRAALRHLYFQESSNELCTDIASPKSSNETLAFQDSHHIDPSFGQKDDDNTECLLPNLSSVRSPNHILAKSSDICLRKAEDLPASNLPNQFVVNVSRPAAPHLGLTRSSFLPKPYSFASNTGNPMRTIQQSKGSVPVI